MLQQKLFRKAAVEKASSPERLDELMRVTPPAAWLVVAGVGCVLLAVVAWGFLGVVTTRVDGQGILLQGGAVLDVTSDSSGRIDELLVGVGDRVEKGQPIAILDQSDHRREIESLKTELDQRRVLARTNSREARALISDWRQQISSLELQLERQEALLKEGLTVPAKVQATRSKLSELRTSIARSQAELDRDLVEIRALERDLRNSEDRLADAEEITSRYTGTVLELVENRGSRVEPGHRILTLEPSSGEVSAYLYVSAKTGKRVKQGMPVRVAPSTVQVEEFGFMLGEVAEVSGFPMTSAGLLKVVGDPQLAESLTGGRPAYQVVARLLVDESTPSGYRWSSSQGPPTQIETGTLCDAQVEVAVKRPVEFVIPMIRETLGMDQFGTSSAEVH